MLKIAVISKNFPHPKFPQSGAFVYKFAAGLAELGAEVTVLAPISQTNLWLRRRAKPVPLSLSPEIDIRYLHYFSFSNFQLLGISSSALGYKLAHRKIESEMALILDKNNKPDVIYGKFLLSGGRHVAELSKKYGVPAIADVGESTLLERLTKKQVKLAQETIDQLSGIVCVSPRLEREVIQLGMNPSRVLMLPNAVDTKRFFAIDRKSARATLGLPHDKKIVIFVGHFIHRKGPERVLEALKILPEDYLGVFLGEGAIELDDSRVLFKGRVPNDQLNTWLNAADVFCLPTLAEGSCNAIEEARAVGLPIVTSDIADVTDFETSKEYNLINPKDVVSIAAGIERAIDEERVGYRNSPMNNAKRAKMILEWIRTIVDVRN